MVNQPNGETMSQVGDIEICHARMGDRSNPALVLCMGRGVQLTDWDDEFCQMFVDCGLQVIRFDHRDVGRSTKFHGVKVDLAAIAAGDRSTMPYGLHDMSDDVTGLMDALGIERFHLVGVSMGAMVAQLVAVRAPERVQSLASIMSTTGDPVLPKSAPAVRAAMGRVAHDRESAIELLVEAGRLAGGTAFTYDEPAMRRRAAAAYDRCWYPQGKIRQTAAILAADDRTGDLRRLRVPTVVVHGTSDPVVPFQCGLATANAILDAEFVVVDGMGHELPLGARETIVNAITANIRRAESIDAIAETPIEPTENQQSTARTQNHQE